MNNKILCIDVETTGLDARVNGIVSLSLMIGVIDYDGRIRLTGDSLNLKIRPFDGCVIEDEALSVNGFTREEIATFKSEVSACVKIVDFLDKHFPCGVKSSRWEKAVLFGYNVRFDQDFFMNMLKRNLRQSLWTWMNFYTVDCYSFVTEKVLTGDMKIESDGKELLNLQLGTVAEHLGIPIDAHNAESDLYATVEVWNKLH